MIEINFVVVVYNNRGYYKCSIVRGCLVCKYVERDVDDVNMFIVIYEGEYNYVFVFVEIFIFIFEFF